MNCRNVRKLLPLAAGGDLAGSRAAEVAAHLEGCPACRAELEVYRSSLKRIREFDSGAAAGASWDEADWTKTVREAVRRGQAAGAVRSKLVLRPAVLALAGLALVAVAAFVLVLSRPSPQPRQVLQAGAVESPRKTPAPIDRALTGAAPAAAPLSQDVISATFVSQETGLRVIWFFDRKFDWKGEGK